MYAISYISPYYIDLHEYKTRQEAVESFEYHSLNLVCEICFNEKPRDIVLKNAELAEFFEREKDLAESINRSHIDIEKAKTGLYPVIQMLPKLVRDFLRVREYLFSKNSDDVYNKDKILQLAKDGFADTLPHVIRHSRLMV